MHNRLGVWVTVTSLATGVATSTAGPRQRPQDAVVSALGEGLSFSVTVPHERAVLVVSGPAGVVFDKEFLAGIAPVFPGTSDNGTPLPDGRYNYALRIVPPVVPEPAGTDAAAGSPDVQSGRRQRMLSRRGSFVVRAGALALDDDDHSERPGAQVSR